MQQVISRLVPQRVKTYLTPPTFEDERKTNAAWLLNTILIFFLSITLPVPIVLYIIDLVTSSPGEAVQSTGTTVLAGGIFSVVFLFILWVMRRGYVRQAAMIFLAITTFASIGLSVLNGLFTSNLALYFLNLVMASLLLGISSATIYGGLSILILLGLFLLEPQIEAIDLFKTGQLWWLEGISVSVYAGLMVALLRVGAQHQLEAIKRSRQAQQILEQERRSLEIRVSERTRQLQESVEITAAVSQILGQDELLEQATQLISERFGYYYVAIFLLDESEQWAVLQAATGEAGEVLLAQGHRLQVGGHSMVGAAISNAEARIALDVGEEAVRFDNPALPFTRSEIALPLLTHGRVLGALDVQSIQERAFSNEDLSVLQTMTNQLAATIENARLLRTVRDSLEAVQRLNRVYLQEAWSGVVERLPSDSYQLTIDGQVEHRVSQMLGLRDAIETQHLKVIEGEQNSSVTAPIILRGQVIGALNIETQEGRKWTNDELAIIEAVSTQAALAMENARLIQEAQAALNESRRLADRERRINDIATRIRQAVDVKSILEGAAQEITRAFGIQQVTIQMGNAHELRVSTSDQPKLPGNGAAAE